MASASRRTRASASSLGQYVALRSYGSSDRYSESRAATLKPAGRGSTAPRPFVPRQFTLNAGPAADVREELLSAVVTDPGALKNQTITAEVVGTQ